MPSCSQIFYKISFNVSAACTFRGIMLKSGVVKFWQKQGIKRIILGREVSLKDIVEIHKRVPKMELEILIMP